MVEKESDDGVGCTVDISPGKYTSEKGEWYLSCDSGDHVLLGIQKPKEWTCPVMALTKVPLTSEQVGELEGESEIIYGPDDAGGFRRCTAEHWEKVTGEKLEKDPEIDGPNFLFNVNMTHVLYLTTDADYVVKFDLAFE